MFRNNILRTSQLLRSVRNNCSYSNEVRPPTQMEKSLNQVTILGRVGGEPQKRGSEDHPLVTFSVATHVNYKYQNGETTQKTEWHRICVFKPNLRDTVQTYLRKGQRVLINGRLAYGEIQTAAGDMKETASIIADEVVFFQ